MARDPFLNQSQDHGGPAMPALKEGQWLFNRRYELARKLGAGGMGVVWLARDHTEETQVALKFLPAVLVQHEGEMKRLKDEVRTGKELRHPGIVATYALEVEDGTAAIVMEYVEGKTLAELLAEQDRGFFEPEEITGWARSIAEAIDYLHAKAKRIHRDLKPANIIVDATGEARLMDFGISRRVQESVTRHSKTSESHGDSSATLAYASPQQLAGKPAHPADDLYSLGALLYELLTGTPPFFRGDAALVAVQIKTEAVTPMMERRAELVSEGANASTGQNVPAAFEKTVLACLEKEREARPASAQAVIEALRAKSGPLTPVSGTQAETPAKTTPGVQSSPDTPRTSPASPPCGPLRRLPSARFGWSGPLWAAALILLSLGAWAIFSQPKDTIEDTASKQEGDQLRADEFEKKAKDEQQKHLAAEAAKEKAKSDAVRASMPQPALSTSLDTGAVGLQYEIPLSSGVKLSLCFCPAGSFTMGSPASEDGHSDDEEQVQVILTQPFWLARTELTQAQWRAVMGTDPSYFKGDDLPVEYVSAEDADACIVKLNEKVPLKGWKWELPTEAQWEYACRAGTITPFHFGSVLTGTEANFNGTYPYGTSTKGQYFGETTPVGSYAPNAWGLCDMHGNVYEWCRDVRNSHKLQGGNDPLALLETKDRPPLWISRINRGGGWNSLAGFCRSADRYDNNSADRYFYLGFRPATVPARVVTNETRKSR